MNLREYYKEYKNKLDPFREVIFYCPLAETEVVDLENELGINIKPAYREFLLHFGFDQDVVKKLKEFRESVIENYGFIKSKYPNYLPIKTKLKEFVDRTLLIKNDDENDNWIYILDVDERNESWKLRKTKNTFFDYLENALKKLYKKGKKRCKNKDKIFSTEFKIKIDGENEMKKAFEKIGFTQITGWEDKYFPNNIFGDQIARFQFSSREFFIQRNEDHTKYTFDIDEPVLIRKEDSKIELIEKLLSESGLEYERMDSGIIETE